jgi:CAAX prenyl protease-like protein
MGGLRNREALLRAVPFGAFVALLALRGLLPEGSLPSFIDDGWLYALQAGVAAALLALWWHRYAELHEPPRWRHVLPALALGAGVCWLWVALDEPWMRFGTPAAGFQPVGPDGAVLWSLIAVRWLGASLIVPVMEELFWRSFLMRWIERHDFLLLAPQQVGLRALLLSSAVFTLAHVEWLAAAAAGLAYAGLYRWTGSLWAAVIAHAATNALLGAWVVLGGHWAYW